VLVNVAGMGVAVFVNVAVGGTCVEVLVAVMVAVLVGVCVWVEVKVMGWKGVNETVAVWVMVAVGVMVRVSVGVMVLVTTSGVALNVGERDVPVSTGTTVVAVAVGLPRGFGLRARAMKPAQ